MNINHLCVMKPEISYSINSIFYKYDLLNVSQVEVKRLLSSAATSHHKTYYQQTNYQ